MVATAFDERIALGAPAGSSGAGTGAYRFCGPGRGGKEGIEDMTRKFPYYFVPRLKEFTGQMDKLPFEAYWYIALTAPRPWISVEGTDDQNCVPNAVKQSVLAAKPVYAFLGVSPDRVGVNYEPHRHMLTAGDWTAALDFADQQLRGIDHHRHFDQFPPESVPHAGQNFVKNQRHGCAMKQIRLVAISLILIWCTGYTIVRTRAIQCPRLRRDRQRHDQRHRRVSKGARYLRRRRRRQVIVPAGNYLIGSIELKSRTILLLETGAHLLGSPDLEDYPVMKVRWEGKWIDGHRALIFAHDADHIAIIGPGKISGNPGAGRTANAAAPGHHRAD